MAIYNRLPRRGYSWTQNLRDDTFYIDGMSRKDTMKELKEYADNHPEKWIYYHDCGYGPGDPVQHVSMFLKSEFLINVLQLECFSTLYIKRDVTVLRRLMI